MERNVLAFSGTCMWSWKGLLSFEPTSSNRSKKKSAEGTGQRQRSQRIQPLNGVVILRGGHGSRAGVVKWLCKPIQP